MVSREDVINGYKFILGREPENDGVIEYHTQHADLMALRSALLDSEEFVALRGIRPSGPAEHVTWPALNRPRTIFLHAPKTAGSSFHEILKRYFPADGFCPERFNGLRHLTASELCRYTFFSGHFDLASTRLIPGPRRTVTFFREPTSRLVSIYNFLRSHKPEIIARNNWKIAGLAATLSIEAFYASPAVRVHPYFNNGMTRMLSDSLCVDIWPEARDTDRPLGPADEVQAINNLGLLSAFGIQERFEDSARHILAVLNLPGPSSFPRERSFAKLAEDTGNYLQVEPADVSGQLQDIMAELTDSDRTLYAEVLSRLEKVWGSRSTLTPGFT